MTLDGLWWADKGMMIAQGVGSLVCATPALKADKDVVLAAVEFYGCQLQHAAEELRNDKEVVLAAVTQNGVALEFASPALRADKEVVLAAVAQTGYALRYAPRELKNDKDVVLAAVRKIGVCFGTPIGFASEELKDDESVVLAATMHDAHALSWASRRLWRNKEFILSAMSVAPADTRVVVLETLLETMGSDISLYDLYAYRLDPCLTKSAT